MKNSSNFLIAIIFLITIGCVVYASPTQTAPNGNVGVPFNTMSFDQFRTGGLGLNNLTIGDGTAKYAKFFSNGSLSLGVNSSDSQPDKSLLVEGSISASTLNRTGSQVCVNTNGDLTTCNYIVYKGPVSTTLSINSLPKDSNGNPPSQITVEVWGAGGPGYGQGQDGTKQNGGATKFSYSGTDLLVANGGKAGYVSGGTYYGGTGGSASFATHSKVSNGLAINGGTGGTGSNGTNKTTTVCSGDSFDVGGTGGDGGTGGLSGFGASTVAPVGGKPGDNALNYSSCSEYQNVNSSDLKYTGFVGDNGFSGDWGAGGSGVSGNGGNSDSDNISPVNDGTNGSRGFPGGGGGGYAKATIAVQSGESYTISAGGKTDPMTWAWYYATGFLCWKNLSTNCNVTSRTSGSGSPGYVRISF